MIKYVVWACCALSIAAGAAAQTSAKTYELKATPTTTFYRFLDAATPPVLTINSGDSVKLETATGTPGYFERLGVPKDRIPAELYETFKDVDDNARRDHTLTGPIFVTGAEPGDSLEIRLRVDRAAAADRAARESAPNGGTLPGEFATSATRCLPRSDEEDRRICARRRRSAESTVLGIDCRRAAAVGWTHHRSAADPWGANMDNRISSSATTLYLPVFVPGALLSIGDGHAAQGHGEVGGSAIETSLKGEIQVILHKGKTLQPPSRGNANRVHDDGVSRGSRRGGEDRHARDARLDRRDEGDQPRETPICWRASRWTCASRRSWTATRVSTP